MNKYWATGLGLAGLGLATGGLGLLPGLLGGAGGAGAALGAGEAAAAGGAGPFAGMSDAALQGIGFAGPESMAAPGLLSQIGSAAGTASKYAPVASLALNAADKGGLLGGHQAPMQGAQLPQYQQIAGMNNDLEAMQQKRMQRRGLMNMGGGNGFA